ncbi:Uncharacterised protein [Bordetella pertussis]|nr:Uncharacterised protein [Bordetella pertussis]
MPGFASASARIWRVPASAISLISARLMPNTMRRHCGAMGLYRCTMARGEPARASKVRAIRSGRDCVSASMVTSSGMRRSSISLRTKSKSVCEADGNATSISFRPTATSCSNRRSLRAPSMGSIRAWLPSRRSVLIQIGAAAGLRAGQARSAWSAANGAKGRYLVAGWASMMSPACQGSLMVGTLGMSV